MATTYQRALGGTVSRHLSGAQFLARTTVKSDGNHGTQVWRRLGPDAAWSMVHEVTQPATETFIRCVGQFVGLLYKATSWEMIYSADLGLTWADVVWPDDPHPWLNIPDTTAGGGRYWQSLKTGIAAEGIGGNTSAGADIWFNPTGPSYGATFATGLPSCPEAGQGEGQAVIWQRPDGLWQMLLWRNDTCYEWTSNRSVPTSWSLTTTAIDVTWDYASGGWQQKNLWSPALWIGRSRLQVLCGAVTEPLYDHHYTAPYTRMKVYTRGGNGAAWVGPALDVPVTMPLLGGGVATGLTAPYCYERPDGVWEVGWLDQAGWVLYRAADPAGTWTVA